ncbi:hypothetical protein CUMW_271720 [Citrus unshiu]|uniref:Uncharacterized protein n=1 Tax=Citrus unshiu TaxID=55188 RepID=A0A2H5QXU7_CITUN|nr:hypothetical protein CUMW_271720 [Citrus unshiu]
MISAPLMRSSTLLASASFKSCCKIVAWFHIVVEAIIPAGCICNICHDQASEGQNEKHMF